MHPSPNKTKLTLNGNQAGKCNKQASKRKKKIYMKKAPSISLLCETRKSPAATVGNFLYSRRPTMSFADAMTILSRSLQFTTPNVLVPTNPTVECLKASDTRNTVGTGKLSSTERYIKELALPFRQFASMYKIDNVISR